MPRTLECTLCRAADKGPLVVLHSPLGNGQEIRPEALRYLAAELAKIADLADAKDMGRDYMPANVTTTY
jgi:hypothetical protein